MKKYLGVLISLALLFTVAAKPLNQGNIYLDNVPTYNGLASFHWEIIKKPIYPVLGVFCSQNNGWVYISELGISKSLTGSGSVIINNETSSALPGSIDYTQPSDCQAFVWDERANGQQPVAITNQVFFVINP